MKRRRKGGKSPLGTSWGFSLNRSRYKKKNNNNNKKREKKKSCQQRGYTHVIHTQMPLALSLSASLSLSRGWFPKKKKKKKRSVLPDRIHSTGALFSGPTHTHTQTHTKRRLAALNVTTYERWVHWGTSSLPASPTFKKKAQGRERGGSEF